MAQAGQGSCLIPPAAYRKRWDSAEYTMEAFEDKWDRYTGPMTRDEHALARLREAYPGWRIWHVPGTGGPGTWCAQPLPLINASSPDALMQAIDQASPGEPEAGLQGFDPEGDRPVRASGS